MARRNGVSRSTDQSMPPPSTMAAHINGGGKPSEMNASTYSQLMGESLRPTSNSDDSIGKDPQVNRALLISVLNIGIAPHVAPSGKHIPTNPLQKRLDPGHNNITLKQSLQVAAIVASKSQQTIYEHGLCECQTSCKDVPAYACILALMAALFVQYEDNDIIDLGVDLLRACLAADKKCPCGCCGEVNSMLQGLTVKFAKKAHGTGSDGIDMIQHVNGVHSPVIENLFRHIKPADQHRYIKAGCFLIRQCLAVDTPRTITLQLKKQLKLLGNASQSCDEPIDLGSIIQAAKEQLVTLTIDQPKEIATQNGMNDEEFPDNDRPHKRRRLTISSENTIDHEDPSFESVIYKKLTYICTGTALSHIENLVRESPAHIRRLDEAKRCNAIRALGVAACQLVTKQLSPDCQICDDPAGAIFDKVGHFRYPHANILLTTLDGLRKQFERSPAARLAALHAYYRILNHVSDTSKLKVRLADAGKFSMLMLRHQDRDIRLAAARMLQSFVRPLPGDSSAIIRENRKEVLENLYKIWQTAKAIPQEGVIIALRNVGEVVGDEELNIVLCHLVEALGNTNLYLSGLAAAEIVQLTQNLRTNVQGLLRPFWKSLGIVVARTLRSRPHLSEQLCELLGMEFNGLSKLIEESALPYFVLNGQNAQIERMAAANASPMTMFEICSGKLILPKILSLLLVQGYEDPEADIMKKLTNVSGQFGGYPLSRWVSINNTVIACELLKMMQSATMGRDSQIYTGLQVLAQLAHKKPTSGPALRRSDAIGPFLDGSHAAIIAGFTHEFDDERAREVKGERRRCLYGLGQLARLGRGRIGDGVPQICALLRAALPDPELCDASFQSWMMLVTSLDETYLEDLLLVQTFAIVVKYWSSLSIESRSMGEKALSHMFKTYESLLKRQADLLPSLDGISDLTTYKVQLDKWRDGDKDLDILRNFITLLADESSVVIENTMAELLLVLQSKREAIQTTLSQEQPHPMVAETIRAILNCIVKIVDNEPVILNAAQCLGCIGKVDTSRVDNVREKRSMVLVSNFAVQNETISFLMFFIEEVVVPEYLSASTLRSKSFLGWALQQLLVACDIKLDVTSNIRTGDMTIREKLWSGLSETTRLVLTPFITSTFVAPASQPVKDIPVPLFRQSMGYEDWLTTLTLNMLSKSTVPNTKTTFEICTKMVQSSPGTVVAEFMIPYTTLNLLLNGTETEKENLRLEFITILGFETQEADSSVQETVRLISQVVFDVLDYLSKWLQEKRKWMSSAMHRAERGIRDIALDSAQGQIEVVESLIKAIPSEVITRRSVECQSYARALHHWDEYIKQKKDPDDEDYRLLQKIYAEIDEPDGIEGISNRMQVLNAESQIMEHRKAGGWQVVHNWYEMQLTENPNDTTCQLNLLHALRESGQHDMLLHQYKGISQFTPQTNPQSLQYAIEAAWSTGQMNSLTSLVDTSSEGDFASILGRNLLKLPLGESDMLESNLQELFLTSIKDLTFNNTTSISLCGQALLQTHVAEDLRILSTASNEDKKEVLDLLKMRTDIIGTDVASKQYVLSVQRAAMQIRSDTFTKQDISTSWLATAKLARKARAYPRALDAVLRAESLGNNAVVFEKAKLMWLEGRHRKAIKTLETAIDSGIFQSHSYIAGKNSLISRKEPEEQNNAVAKAYSLLGRWLDHAGQTSSDHIAATLRKATAKNSLSHNSYYHLATHYNRVLESEKSKSPDKQSEFYISGSMTRTVVENFLRATSTGTKHLFETAPKMLTLWLGLVSNPDIDPDTKRSAQFNQSMVNKRKRTILDVNAKIKKYVSILQPVVFYTMLPQLVARICHGDKLVHGILEDMIVKVTLAFPQHALWTVLAIQKSVDKIRSRKGLGIVTKMCAIAKDDSKNSNMNASDLRELINKAMKLTDELVRVADAPIENKVSKISLSRDLGFNHKIAPSKLVVPVESFLIPNIPPNVNYDALKSFQVFSIEPVTLSAFTDNASVLPSLQKPRKLTIRGTDGNLYAIMAKPKDDLRKDQRLMEFNTMINRFLKQDIEAARRRLYIRTYAVVPLNEECGIVEWVDSLTTMRDILLKLYKERNVIIDYGKIRSALDEICLKSKDKAKDYDEKIAPIFPSVLRYWFAETFSGPDAWLNARIRYTRSTAVMSMVGHILGLGDRHGENILFEEDNGGIMHVDFNCLFDKGLTFDKPETVPFRLTNNMVDAFGVFGVEGPFRRCCEITMELLRHHSDGLMTILETFLHDPTTDFMTAGKRRNKRDLENEVPDTAEKMLEGVKGKVSGMVRGESVPLSVGGYVEEMIRRATDSGNLAQMYIGWCAFL